LSKRFVDTLLRAGIAKIYPLAGTSAVDLLDRTESKAPMRRGLAKIIIERLTQGLMAGKMTPECRIGERPSQHFVLALDDPSSPRDLRPCPLTAECRICLYSAA
jgi:hypothetical protein